MTSGNYEKIVIRFSTVPLIVWSSRAVCEPIC